MRASYAPTAAGGVRALKAAQRDRKAVGEETRDGREKKSERWRDGGGGRERNGKRLAFIVSGIILDR